MKIAIDAMGGDNAPSAIVEGALDAHREEGIESVLVGEPERIEAELKRLGAPGDTFDIRAASQVIGMGESPTKSVKSKPDSSMRVALQLVKDDEAQAVFSAGDTGGAFATGLAVLQRMPGVQRPAIAALIPTLKGFSVMLDVGANLSPRAQHLFQFGIMGSVYTQEVFKKPAPTVGLLNVGGEDSKGTEVLKAVHEIFVKSDLNFVGNVEGSTIFQGGTDVVVCDGFVGNVALKVSESLSEMLTTLLREQIVGSVRSKIGYMFLQNGLKSMRQRTDYSEYGAAPLLGLGGICTIGHGRSNSKAVKNAIRTTASIVKVELNAKIQKEIDKHISIQRSGDVGWRLWNQIRTGIFYEKVTEEEKKSGDEEDEENPPS